MLNSKVFLGETFSPRQDNIFMVKHCQYSKQPYPNTEFTSNNMPIAVAGKKKFVFIYNKFYSIVLFFSQNNVSVLHKSSRQNAKKW